MVTTIFDHAQSKNFQSIFNFCEFVATCKILGCFIHCSGKMVDLKILQSDWLRAFWPLSQEQDFPQIYHFCSNNTANNINFHYETKSVTFLTHFLKFGGKKKFFQTIWLCQCNAQNSEKNNDQLTLYHRTTLANAGGSTSTTAVAGI